MDKEIHGVIARECGKINHLTEAQVEQLFLGATGADSPIGALQDWHFDGRKDFAAIQDSWTVINKRIANRGGDYNGLGYDIHNVADFYAHSNFVVLHVEYYRSKGKDMAKYKADIVPTYSEGIDIPDFKKDYLVPHLRTGTFTLTWNEYLPYVNNSWLGPLTHYNTNLDNETKSVQGSKIIEGTSPPTSYHAIALALCYRDTNIILELARKAIIDTGLVPPEFETEGYPSELSSYAA